MTCADVVAQAVDFVGQRLRSGMAPRKVSEALCDACLAPDTRGCGKGCDNMSVLIIILRSFSRSGDSALSVSLLRIDVQ